VQINAFSSVFRNRSKCFIFLGLLTVVVRVVAGIFPGAVEAVYSNGLFVGIRYCLDYTIGWLPFPVAYLVAGLLLAHWVRKGLRGRKLPSRPFRERLKVAGRNVLGFLGAAIFFFYFLWGFNYHRIPIEEKLGLELDSLDVEALCLEAEWAARQAEADRAAIPGITADSISWDLMPADLEAEVRECVGRSMDVMGYSMHGRIRGRVIVPGGWMLRIGISGIYNPFTGEGNVTGAQTPQKIPFTMAHEMAHACGFGDEGTCNFIGMVACELSDDPFVRYSGQLGYWTHVGNTIAELDPLLYKMLVATLDAGVRADLRANYHNYLRYSGFVSRIGHEVNNAYLKVQGVKEGIKSYDRVVGMMAAWRRVRSEQ
jgi:hypothetical protein